MTPIKKSWSSSKSTPKPTEAEKAAVLAYFQPVVEGFKKQHIKTNPNKRFNYLVDIFSLWRNTSFYLVEKYKSEDPHRIADEFDVKFVRMRYQGKNQFELAYMRHTGSWFVIMDGYTMKDCMEMITTNPVFQPIG